MDQPSDRCAWSPPWRYGEVAWAVTDRGSAAVCYRTPRCLTGGSSCRVLFPPPRDRPVACNAGPRRTAASEVGVPILEPGGDGRRTLGTPFLAGSLIGEDVSCLGEKRWVWWEGKSKTATRRTSPQCPPCAGAAAWTAPVLPARPATITWPDCPSGAFTSHPREARRRPSAVWSLTYGALWAGSDRRNRPFQRTSVEGRLDPYRAT